MDDQAEETNKVKHHVPITKRVACKIYFWDEMEAITKSNIEIVKCRQERGGVKEKKTI